MSRERSGSMWAKRWSPQSQCGGLAAGVQCNARSHDERRGLRDLEPEIARDTFGKLQHRAIFRYEPIGLRGMCQFEKLLVVAILAFGQGPRILGGLVRLDPLREPRDD